MGMNIIRKRRKELKITQLAMEKKLGIKREKIGQVENGVGNVSIRDLKKICKFLGIDWEMYYETDGLKITEKV